MTTDIASRVPARIARVLGVSTRKVRINIWRCDVDIAIGAPHVAVLASRHVERPTGVGPAPLPGGVHAKLRVRARVGGRLRVTRVYRTALTIARTLPSTSSAPVFTTTSAAA